MASNQTATNMPIPIAPPGLTFTAAIGPAVTFIVLGTAMGSLLIPILFALFFFSTSALRRRPVFIMNVVAVFLGLTLAIFNDVLEIRGLLAPLSLTGTDYVAYGIITALGPILVDSVLILRLLAVFPYDRTPKLKFYAIMAFPILMKIGRLINTGIFSRKEQFLVSKGNPAEAVVILLVELPNTKIEWFLQIFDNAYASGIFLWKLNPHKNGGPGAVTRSRRSFANGVSSLFWIAASNFVFPVIFNIIQLIIYFTTPITNLTLVLYVQQANYYISIIGVVFATIWSTGNQWAESNRSDQGSSSHLSTWNAGGRTARCTRTDGSNKPAIVSYTTTTLTTTDSGRDDVWGNHSVDKGSLPLAIMGKSETV